MRSHCRIACMVGVGMVSLFTAAHSAFPQEKTRRWQDTLSRPTHSNIRFNMHSVTMPDGVVLSAAVWRPDVADERFPVIMLSTPYNKISNRSIEQGDYFARRGYAYVSYDKRGRYDSEGRANRYGPDDGADFAEMQKWAATQPWSTGKVGTLGGSASGMVQWLAALHQSPYLAAVMPEVAPDDHHYNTYREEPFSFPITSVRS